MAATTTGTAGIIEVGNPGNYLPLHTLKIAAMADQGAFLDPE